jgi:hypothetical protein
MTKLKQLSMTNNNTQDSCKFNRLWLATTNHNIERAD